MSITGPDDLAGLLKIGRIVGLTIQTMADAMKPGMTTAELDAIGAEFLAKNGARSAPQMTYNFPAVTCISINDAVAHGIPSPDRVIQPGDLVNIDVSAEMNGFIADSGASFPVPPVSDDIQRLCDHGQEALEAALSAVRAGQPINVIGGAVEEVAKRGGYRIIRELGGHGVGRKLHEPPHNIPNFYKKNARKKLKAGMVITVEPFLSTGRGKIYTDDDGWTLRTIDGALAAQYEHTIVITDGDPIRVTAV